MENMTKSFSLHSTAKINLNLSVIPTVSGFPAPPFVHPPEIFCQLRSFASEGMKQLRTQPEAVARAGVSVAAEKAATMEAKTTFGFLEASMAVCRPLAL